MEERITREELLERLFHDDYENLKGKKLRLTRVRVPGKSLDFAHVITPSDPAVYQNLALNIGVHEGEDHTGESIGYAMGGHCGCNRCCSEGGRCSGRIYGSFQWSTDYTWRFITGDDRSRRSCEIFS